jgi:DNA polymerase-1
MGDAVDNIPGIAGVGEKTAAKLLKEYDTSRTSWPTQIISKARLVKRSATEKKRPS